MTEKCEICGKIVPDNMAPFFYTIENESYFCVPHARTLKKEIKEETRKGNLPESIRLAEPNTPEWSKLCKIKEAVVIEFIKRGAKPMSNKT